MNLLLVVSKKIHANYTHRLERLWSILMGVFIFLSLFSCQEKKEVVHLNEIQVIGSHNSYKIAIEPLLWKAIYQQDSVTAISLQYEHIPLLEQLDLGLRNLELDVLHDPQGGYYKDPLGLEIVEQAGGNALPYDENDDLLKPGLKVFHVPEIDFRSHQLLFKDCLKELRIWSYQNPQHIPVVVTINAIDEDIGDPRFRKPYPFTSAALDSIDLEITEVFTLDKLITPDHVRGEFKTLEEAVLKKGWPELDEVRSKFLFVLNVGDKKQNLYTTDHPSLKDRKMFVDVKEGVPEAAFRIINDPVENFDYIQKLVGKGYFIRTRSDAGTVEARTHNYERLEKAIASGAQIITTDYYQPSTLFPSSYKIAFENGKYVQFKKLK